MHLNASRFFVFAGLLTAPVLALAQEETPSEEASAESALSEATGSNHSHTALTFGMHSHSFSVDTTTPEAPALTVDIEHYWTPHFTVFGGGHLSVGMKAVGIQAGSRLYLGDESFQGIFLGMQAEGTLFERNEWTSGSQLSFGGHLGYAQKLGERWLVSLAAGADISLTRSETRAPHTLTPECILFTPCLLAGDRSEPVVEETEAVRPFVRLAAVFRF
ncbi:DUF3575 domain-containing protein [Vitiosangium sp. GDMCC 1.1324]|uniref:DUF3575 domain-containing protein n=1 Tax=Vitiosangium sp. (strain GDMCC 1.1324) TaxID=2138576 RepID=UPI001E2D99B6|nr:DUF3575 domain-containing protein [Vitiosangium sp. GDMCC 1.1324]